jgi:transcriptional regulator with XRE-family HTH domain
MKKPDISHRRDSAATQSRLRDTPLSLSEVLRDARQRKQLSQQDLARKLGLRQRQISDLERATTDSRLSTIQNVARALDLELMLIPRHLLAAVEALQRAGTEASKRPLYALDNDETEDAAADGRHVEVGDTSDTHSPRNRPPRARKGSRR